MIRTNKRLALCLILLSGCLCFIWGNSLLNAAASSTVSDFVGKIMGVLPDSPMAGGLPLRKIAHFLEFAALGWLLIWLTVMLGQRRLHALETTLLCGLAAACVDETIQMFSPGRSSSLADVWLDAAGVLAGGLLLLLVCCLRREIHRAGQRR